MTRSRNWSSRMLDGIRSVLTRTHGVARTQAAPEGEARPAQASSDVRRTIASVNRTGGLAVEAHLLWTRHVGLSSNWSAEGFRVD